jgi:hypothetical protein
LLEKFVIKIPAQAFGELHPKDLPLGSILKFRESWSMLVGYEEGERDLLILLGELAGQLIKLPNGMRKCPAIIAPFTWFPAVDEGTAPVIVDDRTTTLALTDSGLVIIGGDLEGYDTEYRAFRMDGLCDREHDAHGSGRRFVQWTAELAHKDRPFSSLGQLFRIEASKVADK